MKDNKKTIDKHLNLFAECLEYTPKNEETGKDGYASFKSDVIVNKDAKTYPYYMALSEVINNSGTDTNHAYQWTSEALDFFIECDLSSIEELEELEMTEAIDNAVDIYNYDLTQWLSASDDNIYWLDEAVNQYEAKTNILGVAQYCAIEEVFGKVREAILKMLGSKTTFNA
jgi:hypothetical protein